MGAYDALVIRSPWDYTHRPAALLAWLDARAATTPLLNCAHTIRWNLDKRYLLELEAEGVTIVPTTVCDDAERIATALTAVGAAGADEVVVKPTVSAGSKDTGRFAIDDPQALALGEHVLTKGKHVMVQPCIPGVAEAGERSVVVFDGVPSHTVAKGPLLALGAASSAASTGSPSPPRRPPTPSTNWPTRLRGSCHRSFAVTAATAPAPCRSTPATTW